MKDIIIEVSYWVGLAHENAKFVKMGEQDERPDIITGVNWLALDEDARGDYVLEDVIAAQRDSHDGEIVDLQVFEDDSI